MTGTEIITTLLTSLGMKSIISCIKHIYEVNRNEKAEMCIRDRAKAQELLEHLTAEAQKLLK